MKERPILFSGEMIRAILSGNKTQTRRVLNPLCRQFPIVHFERWGIPYKDIVDWQYNDAGNPLWVSTEPDGTTREWKCPYGEPEDRLWVRETWAVYGQFQSGEGYCYRADGDKAGIVWRPSIFMPRQACRIKLEITGVRVERLQDISEEDAQAEGVAGVGTFGVLWNEINAKRGYGWDTNPWVFVIDFKPND